MTRRRRLRVLAVTSLFPNAALPHSSSFNRQQLAALGELCQLDVWAPIPWFPLADRLAPSSSAGRAAVVPASDQIGSLEVAHPRVVQLPVVGRPIAGPLFAASLARRLHRARRGVDVVFATWAYPDGWAATVLGSALSLPTVVKVHGSDINVVAKKAVQRAQIRAVLPRASAVIAVSRPLAEGVEALGVPAERVHWIANGVDTVRFVPRDRQAARIKLSLAPSGELVLYVGNLKREKGVLDLLDAWARVRKARPKAHLYVVGGGPAGDEVNSRVSSIGSATAVGAVPHSQVATWMSAADVLCLPSWNEGTPNVVMEAHASGRPVVATRVGGTPDLITSAVLGRLVAVRDSDALAGALIDVLQAPVDSFAVLAAAKPQSWAQSAAAIYEVLEKAAS